MHSLLLIALLGFSWNDLSVEGRNTTLSASYLQGQWAPKSDPQGCTDPTGPRFLPDQKIPTPTGEAVPYLVLPNTAGISFKDWDGHEIAYLIKVLGENEMQVEVKYNGHADEIDEPVIHIRCEEL